MGLLRFALVFQEPSLYAVFLDTVALLERMLVWTCYPVAFSIATVSIDSLHGVEFAGRLSDVYAARGRHAAIALSKRLIPIVQSTECSGLPRRWETGMLGKLSGIEVFGDFDLHIAKITLAGDAFPFLLVRIGRLLGAWWASFEPAVLVV